MADDDRTDEADDDLGVGARDEVDPQLESLLEYLREARGFDFTGYKRPTLRRRIQRRMQDLDIGSYEAYQDHLEVHPDEYVILFNTILINVTSFLRDPDAWEALADDVLPAIIDRRDGSPQPIRVWSAACSSGQEAYTIAMLLCEALDAEAFASRVKIYGTDVDEEALEQARDGVYAEDDLEALPDHLRERYFARNEDGRFVVDRELRRSVIFGRHDLLRDAPISRLDLLLCRNTLMYFNAEIQDHVLRRFHFALRQGGYLFLGKAETLLKHDELFEPVDLKHRVFRTTAADGATRARFTALRRGPDRDDHGDGFRADLVVAAFGSSRTPHLIVSDSGILVAANDEARRAFGIRPADLGRLFQDLDVSYRPADLGSLVNEAARRGSTHMLQGIPRSDADGQRWYDVEVVPLRDGEHGHRGVSVTFTDVTRHKELEHELQSFNEELETTSEELQSSNEELETTNEELQSSNEELETMNEELQSSNEELETMNEELQSANAELTAVNDVLEQRRTELDRANAFLRSVMGSLRSGVVVVDRDLVVQQWSPKARDQWGLRSDEVLGSHLLNLDIGLPVDELRGPINACINDGNEVVEVTLDARDRTGREVRCAVRCTPLVGSGGDVGGCILLLETEPEG